MIIKTDNLGAHMSISGGAYTSIARGESVNCNAIQIFTKNNTQWKAKDLTETDIEKFKTALEESNISSVIAHNSYLINLAAIKEETWEKSMVAFLDEMKRCDQLGIPHLVFHPGSHGGAGEEAGLDKIASSINTLLEQGKNMKVNLAFETTAGQGKSLGYKFEHFQYLLERIEQKDRIFFCIDTCHIFAAGYDIATKEGYDKTFSEFDDLIGTERVAAFHLNDSKKPLGSRVDRHEHIGKGEIGILAFEMLMNDKRFSNVPMVLETPKKEDLADDIINLNLLRSL